MVETGLALSGLASPLSLPLPGLGLLLGKQGGYEARMFYSCERLVSLVFNSVMDDIVMCY